jgi:predicted RNase H-like HicB family nuclease
VSAFASLTLLPFALKFLNMSAVAEIVFQVEPCAETGGYVARWDAPRGGGITTQGDSFAELDAMITDAVDGYFESGKRPKRVRLHFSRDPILAVA